MLKIFCGNDEVKIRDEATKMVENFAKKGFAVEIIDEENFSPGIFADAAGGESLFGTKTCYVVDTPSSKTEFYESIKENLPVLSESENIFIVIEGTLLAPEKKVFTKYAESIEELKKDSALRFNTFSLTDALAKKDKKNLWLLFHEAKLSGIALEEIVGVLWWQLKTLRLAALTKSAEEAGIKDFPYNKARRELSKFKDGELEMLSNSLNTLLHESRLGLCDLDISLERFLLRL
jgi:DNA polymerase III delta subunit